MINTNIQTYRPEDFAPLVKQATAQTVRNHPKKYMRLSAMLYGTPHLITAPMFYQIDAAFQRILAGVPMNDAMSDALGIEDEPLEYSVQPNGVAVLPIKGPLSREISALEKACGGVDLAEIAALVAKADNDPDVRALVLSIDSPGGTVNGTEEAAAAIQSMRKPVIAHTAGMAASGALWLYTSADARYIAESAQAGSVGVYMAMLDQSRRYDQAGVKVDLIKSTDSPLKAAGFPGTSLSEGQREQMQAGVDYLYSRFAGHVSAAMPNVKPEALTGGMYFGSQAVEMGLADSVASLAQAITDAGILADLQPVKG